MKDSFDLQGHRGCRGLVPENTWPAMKAALDLNVTTLEMDVVITKDKKVVLSHEPWFSHEITTTANGAYISEAEEKKFNIYRMAYEEVKKFDVGLKPHPRFPEQRKIKVNKPMLAAIFDSVKTYMLSAMRPYPFFNIEIKSTAAGDGIYHPKPEAFTDLVMQVIDSKGMKEKVIIQSFDPRPLRHVHKKYPSVKTALLIEQDEKRSFEVQLKQLAFTPSIYSPHFSLVTKELVQKCHQQNIRIIPWTVNEKQKADSLKKLGINGIITDYPDRIF